MDDKACCCPSRPVVKVLMPSAAAGAVARVIPDSHAGRISELALLWGTDRSAASRGLP